MKMICRRFHTTVPFTFFEICTRHTYEMFVNKHLERIEFVKNYPTFQEIFKFHAFRIKDTKF